MSEQPQNIVLENKHGRVELSTWGARVTSYVPAGGEEVFFRPANPALGGEAWAHGGVPVCWPWFGRNGVPGSKNHGIARFCIFEETARVRREDGDAVTLVLRPGPELADRWPYASELTVTVTLGEALTIEMTTRNTGTEEFLLTEGLHAYFRAGDRRRIRVEGAEGCPYCDSRVTQAFDAVWSGELRPDKSHDHVFTAPDATWEVIDPVLRRRLTVSARGNRKFVLWVPEPYATGEFLNLAAEEYDSWFCLEPSTLFRNEGWRVGPGETRSFAMTVRSNPL